MIPPVLPPGSSPGARPAASSVIAAVLVSAMGLATIGCNQARLPDEVHPAVTDHTRRHPIVVVAEVATLDLDVLPNGPGSEARSYIETLRFVRRYRREGKGPLVIALPGRGGHPGAVAEKVRHVRGLAAQAGISQGNIRTRQRARSEGYAQVVTVSYDRIAAIGPTCGDWSENVARNPENLPYPNFGCASQRNLAAMVATPTDLMFPAQEVARQGDRRGPAYKTFTGPQNPQQQTPSLIQK